MVNFDLQFYNQITDDIFVALYDTESVVAFEFRNVIWGRDPKSKIYVEATQKAKCVLYFKGGGSLMFDVPPGTTPEELVRRLDCQGVEFDDDDE